MGITVKIGRHEYEITQEDCFLDNGKCVQLMTQSQEPVEWGRRANPVLSKRLVKELDGKYRRREFVDGRFRWLVGN